MATHWDPDFTLDQWSALPRRIGWLTFKNVFRTTQEFDMADAAEHEQLKLFLGNVKSNNASLLDQIHVEDLKIDPR